MAGKSGQARDAAGEPDPLEGLTVNQSRAAEALAQGQSTEQAAAVAGGVSARTVRRWRKEPAFALVLLELRRESVGQAVGVAQRFAAAAVATLVRLMNDANASAGSKVAACSAVLKVAWGGIELEDVLRRIQALEQFHPAQGPPTVPEKPHRNGDSRDEEDEP